MYKKICLMKDSYCKYNKSHSIYPMYMRGLVKLKHKLYGPLYTFSNILNTDLLKRRDDIDISVLFSFKCVDDPSVHENQFSIAYHYTEEAICNNMRSVASIPVVLAYIDGFNQFLQLIGCDKELTIEECTFDQNYATYEELIAYLGKRQITSTDELNVYRFFSHMMYDYFPVEKILEQKSSNYHYHDGILMKEYYPIPGAKCGYMLSYQESYRIKKCNKIIVYLDNKEIELVCDNIIDVLRGCFYLPQYISLICKFERPIHKITYVIEREGKADKYHYDFESNIANIPVLFNLICNIVKFNSFYNI